MSELTEHGNQSVQQLAQRYGVSVDAVQTLLRAVSAGGGTMAQFYHPDLGGGGQWMQGGMTMVGDMFNHGLQAKVSGLCSELSSLLASSQQVFAPPPQQPQYGYSQQQQSSGGFMSSSHSWWPSDLGSPSSSGGQNDTRYAVFPSTRRLALQRGGQVTIYDTLDHQIGGVQQQQGGGSGSLEFSSQLGTFRVDSLPIAGGVAHSAVGQVSAATSGRLEPNDAAEGGPRNQGEIFAAIDKLGDLHHRGILSDEEFRAKKAELLSRL